MFKLEEKSLIYIWPIGQFILFLILLWTTKYKPVLKAVTVLRASTGWLHLFFLGQRGSVDEKDTPVRCQVNIILFDN